MTRLLMLGDASSAEDPLVREAVRRAAALVPEAKIDVLLVSARAGCPIEDGEATYWPVSVPLFPVPGASGVLRTFLRIAAINGNSRRRAHAVRRSPGAIELSGRADVIISLSTPTDRAALGLGRSSHVPLMAGINAALAARRRGEW